MDTYPQQTNLTEKEKVVLKTILIMQAVDQRLGGAIPVLKPTDQNLSYAFEGDWDVYENECRNIAKALVKKGVLIHTQIADGKQVYSAAVLAGDGAKIDRLKDDVRKNSTTTKLVEEGNELGFALGLTPPLRLRYATNIDTGALPVVTTTNFVKTMDVLKSKDISWHFYAVLALAKNDEEAQSFRNLIKKTIANAEYKNIIVVDALSTPLGLEAFEDYVNYSAMSMYYNGNNNQQSKDSARKAKEVLDRGWKDRIHDGSFIVWSYLNQDGEKATGSVAVQTIMQTVVLNRYNHIPDFTKGLTESQLKNTQAKQVAKYGFALADVKGLIAGCEKSVLGKVWGRDSYWSDSDLDKESISIIKRAVDRMIADAFKVNGRVSIDEICEFVETTYGFAPCNLTSFIIGFLLKEYRSEPYRSQDSEGHRESMTPDKLSEMIGNYYSKKAKTTYIVSLTPEEKSFYELTEKAWDISPNTCTSPTQAGSLIQVKMREFVFPVWTLEEVDETGVFDIVKKYISLIQSDGATAHDIAITIGKIGMQRPSCADNLSNLLTADNCQKGMSLFLQHFDGGKICTLAREIGATEHLLADIKKMFSVKHAAQWITSIASDHGASRLAVLHHQEEKYETDTKGEHSGRCCKEFPDADLPNAIRENGYFVLSDYGRFKNSRAANVEVHGGATLEEVVVPVIRLSLRKQDDVVIKLLNADAIYCERHSGTLIEFYISDVENKNNIALVIAGKRYVAVPFDSTHYSVTLNDIKRAKKNIVAEIYDGDNLIGSVKFDIKGKAATLNTDFDDLF